MPLFRRRREDEPRYRNGGAAEPDDSPGPELARWGVDIPPFQKLTTTAAGQDVWVAEADRSGTVELWRMVRGVHQNTGLWPFLLTAKADMLPDLVHFAAQEADLDELARGEALNSDDVLREMAAMAAGDDEDDDEAAGFKGELDESTYDEEAQALSPDVVDDVDSHLQQDQPHRLALIEAAHGWEVPARLAWSGATNYDLSGAQHLAVLRRWGQRYGAELLTLGFDTIELLVERPPAGKVDALAVAREQFAYCPDIVWQGVGTIGALAASQARSPVWYFWWD
ncbi:MAG: DUF4253 domain-containing protein [Actinomycetota bacterium]|nr:DUF4253 domain-containing protein [Actinomycetota bacterium]